MTDSSCMLKKNLFSFSECFFKFFSSPRFCEINQLVKLSNSYLDEDINLKIESSAVKIGRLMLPKNLNTI